MRCAGSWKAPNEPAERPHRYRAPLCSIAMSARSGIASADIRTGAERTRERLARLAAEGLELTVAVDSLAPAAGLSAALDRRGASAELLVELDVGLHRTGQVTSAGALDLARQLSSLPALEVGGISGYPGH